jgi:two-component system sensor histidine kinase DegS
MKPSSLRSKKVSNSAGDLALDNLDRLGSELHEDLDSIEELLAELESDCVVRRSRVEELATVLHVLGEKSEEEGKAGILASGCSVGPETIKNARRKLGKLLEDEIDVALGLGAEDRLVKTYSAIRERLMDSINAIELVTLALKKYTEESAAAKPGSSMKFQSSSTAPGSKVVRGSSAIIRSQELERQRIAREIHDGPAQAIANVVLRMDILGKIYEKDPSKVRGEIARMKEIAQGALDEIRGFIFDLRPMTLQDLGLIATIKRIVSSLKELSKIDVRLVVEGEERPLVQLVSLAVFRIAQEAMNNIKKSSQCNVAWVHLKWFDDRVVLIVEDDGVGFDVNEPSNSEKKYVSFGLLGMQERADDINAELEVISSPGKGTKVVLMVPTVDNPAIEIADDAKPDRAENKQTDGKQD